MELNCLWGEISSSRTFIQMSNIPPNIIRENKKLEHITKKKKNGTRNRTKDDPDLSLKTLK